MPVRVKLMPGNDAHAAIRYWAGAVCIWLGLGFSLGWYYTITYFGRSGWPLPMLEPLGACLLYYFSVLNIATEGQAIHWMLVFPIAGTLWVVALELTSRYWGRTGEIRAVVAWRLALSTIPLILPAPWLAFVAAQTEAGLSWTHMIQVALRRAFVSTWPGLNAMYAALGWAGLLIQVSVYHRVYPFRGKTALYHYLSTAILYFIACCVLGALAALPLRGALE